MGLSHFGSTRDLLIWHLRSSKLWLNSVQYLNSTLTKIYTRRGEYLRSCQESNQDTSSGSLVLCEETLSATRTLFECSLNIARVEVLISGWSHLAGHRRCQMLSRDSIAFAHVLLYISFPGLTASFILGHTQYTHFHPTWPSATVINAPF
jgi:hypothetical protein